MCKIPAVATVPGLLSARRYKTRPDAGAVRELTFSALLKSQTELSGTGTSAP